MDRKYKLLKDMPDVKAGAMFLKDISFSAAPAAYYLSGKTGTGYNCYRYPASFVENSPEWFEEVKEPQMVTVPLSGCGPVYEYNVRSSHPIPFEKLPLIKTAIENVLNCKLGNIYAGDGEKLFTWQEVEQRERLAFEAARRVNPLFLKYGNSHYAELYHTFDDYKKAK